MEAWTWLTTNIQPVVASEKFMCLVFLKPIATPAEKIYSHAQIGIIGCLGAIER